MYELTCPACQSKSQHLFVRIGARSCCAQCQHRYQLATDLVLRQVELPSEDNTSTNPLLFGSPVTKPPAPAHPSHSPRPNRRAQENRSISEDPPLMTPEVDPTLHPAPKPKPPAEVQRMIAQRRAQRERKRLIIRIVSIILSASLPVALLIYMFSMARQIDEPAIKSDNGTTLFQNDTTSSSSANDLRTLNLVSVKAERLAAPFWRLGSNKPYEEPAGQKLIQLDPGTPVGKDDATVTYMARYTVHSQQVLELAILHLSLIDSQNRVIATNQIPMPLLTDTTIGLRSRDTLRVDIPRDLASSMVKMGSFTEVIQTMGNCVELRDPVFESQIQGEDAILHIAAYNSLDKPLSRCVFSVVVIDNHGAELAQWKINWQRSVDPKQRVEFLVNIPVSRLWTIGGWKLAAFGETEKMQ